MKELRASKAAEAARYLHLGKKINSFISGLEETKENIELELSAVLSRKGVDMSSMDVATAASADVAPDEGLQLADDASGCSSLIKRSKTLRDFSISQFLSF